MKTKGNCLNMYLRYLDEATKKGVDMPVIKNADYRDKFNYFLNEAQTYIAGFVKIPAVFQVTQNPIPNQLGFLQCHDLVQYLPGTNKTYSALGSKSYYFEIDNIGTVLIKVNGVTVKTISNTLKRQFTVYKGNISSNPTDTVTIEFTGNYPYNIRNRALYAYAFPTDDDVQPFTVVNEYSMPSDFMSFDTVIIRGDPLLYQNYIAYKWESNKKVVLRSYEKGSFDIHYFKYPTEILPNATESTPLEVEDKAIDLVVLQAGIMATASDNPSLSSWLRSIYLEKVQNIVGAEQPTETKVETVYSM